jgi:hypothetical protein
MENNKLPEEFKRKWIDALRSGEYKQGFGTLCETINGKSFYCCLGVAGVVAGLNPSDMHNKAEFGGAKFVYGLMPPPGFPEVLISDLNKTLTSRLINMNDGNAELKSHSFSEIADYIEQNL